ncbi:MAG: HXXEE domain-containing protein [Thermodesulfobacteriota bacterium]
MDILTSLGKTEFIVWLWVFAGTFALHELEEWNILRWYRRNYVDLPPSSDQAVRAWIVLVVLIGCIWCAAATLPGNPVFAAYVFLPAIAVALQNALQHVYWLLYFRQYAPGIVTSLFGLIPLGVFLFIRAIGDNLVPL